MTVKFGKSSFYAIIQNDYKLQKKLINRRTNCFVGIKLKT
jgi:hypothetical protein